MSIVGSYRLYNAIENGTYTAATLSSALTGSARLTEEFHAICTNKTTLKLLLTTKPEIVLNSTYSNLYTPVLSSNPSALAEILSEREALLTTVVSNTAMSKILLSDPVFLKSIYTNQLLQRVFGSDAMYGKYGEYVPYFSPITLEGTTGQLKSSAYNASTGTTLLIVGNTLYRRTRNSLIFRKANVPAAMTTMSAVANNGSTFVVVGSPAADAIAYSTDDGESWTKATNPTANVLTHVVGTSSTFVIGGANGTILYSTNASSWTTKTYTNLSTNAIVDLKFDGTNVFICTIVHISRSTDGGNTFAAGIATTTGSLTSIASSGSGRVVVVSSAGSNRNYGLSTDSGASYVFTNTGIIAGTTNLKEVVWTGNGFYAASSASGLNDGIAFSPDGSNNSWLKAPSIVGLANRVHTIAGKNGVIVVNHDGTEGVAVNNSSNKQNLSVSRNGDGLDLLPSANGTAYAIVNDAAIFFNGPSNLIYASNLPKAS